MASSAKALAFTLLFAIAACDGTKGKPDAPQGNVEGGKSDTATAGASIAEKPLAQAVDRSHAGTPAPTAGFEGPDGKPVTLASFKGKPLLVNLWATWCAPCVREMPALDRLAARTAGKLTLLAVSQDMAGHRLVDPYFAKAGFKTLKPSIDKENNLALAISAAGLPTTILYGADGKEVWRVNGPVAWDDAGTEKTLGL